MVSMEIDGQRVLVDQATQEVTVYDEKGQPLLHERLQVAAGSKSLGALDAAESVVRILSPVTHA